MKYLSRIVCGLTLAASVASCAVARDPVNTAPVQTTPAELVRVLTDLMKQLEVTGQSIMSVNGGNIACACVPTAQPNGPPPPPPEWNKEAVQRAIKALQAIERDWSKVEKAVVGPMM